jgi:hypothetical protein
MWQPAQRQRCLHALHLQWVLGTATRVASRVRISILDACLQVAMHNLLRHMCARGLCAMKEAQ